MASPDILDFERLLAPIPGEVPTGVELMEDKSPSSTFFAVREAVKSARDAELRMRKKEVMDRIKEAHEDRAEADHAFRETVEPPDWQKVYDLAVETLATKSKDLWIAAWLIDALTRLHGFAGLRDGFRLIRELCEKYWDGIHPEPADGTDYERTVSQLNGLANGALAVPMAEIPLTEETSVGPFRSTDYIEAKELEKITDQKQRESQLSLGIPSLEMIQEAVDETSKAFFVNLDADIEQALSEHKEMSQLLTDLCGKNVAGLPVAPPTAKIRASLEGCRANLHNIAGEIIKEALEGGAEELVSEAGHETEGDHVPVQQAAAQGAIDSREDAFRTLNQAAKFFRKTEPLSPIAEALERIVKWRDKSFSDLMEELIPDKKIRADVFRRTGIKTDEGSDENESP